MKRTKLFISVLLLIVLLCSLTGCIVIPFHDYYDDIDPETVASIQVYNLRNADKYSDIFLQTETPLHTLHPTEHAAFLDDLAQIRFTHHVLIVLAAVDPSFRYGDLTVRINFTDGSFRLISDCHYAEAFDKDGNVIDRNRYGCDEAEWMCLVQKYLSMDSPDASSSNSANP